MANTLINSEIVRQLVNEKMKGKEKLLSLASDIGVLPNGVQDGDTYTVIKFAHLTEAVDITKGQPIPVEDVKSTKTSEVIEHKGKGFQLYDIEKETVIGGKSIIDMKATDVAEVFIRAMEKSLGGKMMKAPLKFALASQTEVTATEINTAMTNAFGDNQDVDGYAGIVVSSVMAQSFYAMPEFIDATKTYTQQGNGIVRNGLIGYFRSIPVFMSDVTTVGADGVHTMFIIKKNALGYKRLTGEVETVRNAQYKRDEVYGDIMFLTTVLDDTGLVVCNSAVK